MAPASKTSSRVISPLVPEQMILRVASCAVTDVMADRFENAASKSLSARVQASIAFVPLVVVNAMSVFLIASLEYSVGELPKSKASGLTQLRSPPRRTCC